MDPGDISITEDETGGRIVELRAERSGRSTAVRVYRLTVTAQDLAGNEVTRTATCSFRTMEPSGAAAQEPRAPVVLFVAEGELVRMLGFGSPCPASSSS